MIRSKRRSHRTLQALRTEACIAAAACLLAGSCSAGPADTVTLGEWIRQMNEKAGITSYREEVPYFINIDEDSVWFADVQAAVEWDILSADYPFDPDEGLSREWAAFTLMNLAAKQNESSDLKIKDLNDTQFPDQVKASVSSGLFSTDDRQLFHPKELIGKEEAEKAMDTVIAYINKREIRETVNEIRIRDGIPVFEKEPLSFDSEERKAVYPAGDAPETGDAAEIGGIWYTVKGIDADGKTAEALLEEADLEKIAESVHVEGHDEPDLSRAVFAEDSETNAYIPDHRLMGIRSLSKTFNLMGYKVTVKTTSAGITADVNRTMPRGSVVYASLKLNGIDTDYVWNEDSSGLKDGYLRISFNTSEDLGIRSSTNKQLFSDFSQIDPKDFPATVKNLFREKKDVVQSTLTLCTLNVPVAGNPALSLQIALQLKMYASGKIQIALAQSNVLGCEIRNGNMRLIRDGTHTSSASIQADAGVSGIAKLALTLASRKLMDVYLEAGAKAKMKTVMHMYDETGKRTAASADIPLDIAADAASTNPNVLVCGDLSAYWVMDIGLNSAATAAGKLGFGRTFNILNESNAPLFGGLTKHMENMQFVDHCTRKDRLSLPSADPLHVSKRITLDRYAFSVRIGATKQIEVTGLPDGYEVKDIVFASDDSTVASVSSDGTITGIATGSTVIRVTTDDGMHEITCNVIVPEEAEN